MLPHTGVLLQCGFPPLHGQDQMCNLAGSECQVPRFQRPMSFQNDAKDPLQSDTCSWFSR